MGLFDSIKNAPGNAWHAVKSVAHGAEHQAETVAHGTQKVAGMAKDVLVTSAEAANYLAHHPPDLDQVSKMGHAIVAAVRTGEEQRIYGDLPAYPKLDAALLDAARKQGEGKTLPQPFIAGNAEATSFNEPVNLVLTGSKDELVAALRKAGWRQAPGRTAENFLKMAGKSLLGTDQDVNGPVSAKYIDGKSEALAFNKNDDFNTGRDHLRIFPADPDPVTGEQRWQIAGSRDVCMALGRPEIAWHGPIPTITKGPTLTHHSDPAVDGERDLILQSLLDAGVVKDWSAVKGDPQGKAEQQKDGTYKYNGHWTTDGYIYDIKLGTSETEG